ncbi:RHS repeat-associated core domain-containing protein [Pseudomonas sp. ITEM 17296]|nr:RHS repeat-associated core domain-containing protein [Pseudomonas sp. ITEM 17296]
MDKMEAIMSTSQQWYFYSPDGLATVSHHGTEATTLVRAAGRLVAQHDNGQATFFSTDFQGSVLQLTGRDVSFALRYSVYGHDTDKASASMLRFTGQRKDPFTEQYLLGNGYRGYSTVLMRLNAPDTLSPFGDGGLNAYCYCGDDPVNKVDPTGHVGLPPNSFLTGGVFTKRWGLRAAASYAVGQKAPALKTLSVKKALADIDPHLRARVKNMEKNKSWQLRDVQRLENASISLQGKTNRFELAHRYYEADNYFIEAEAALKTKNEIVLIKQWVDRKLAKTREMIERRELFDALPFSPVGGKMLKVRRDG